MAVTESIWLKKYEFNLLKIKKHPLVNMNVFLSSRIHVISINNRSLPTTSVITKEIWEVKR